MISKPTKIASTNTVSSMTRSVISLPPFGGGAHRFEHHRMDDLTTVGDECSGGDFVLEVELELTLVHEMLQEELYLSVDDYKSIQGDFKSKMVENLIYKIRLVLNGISSWEEHEKKAVDLLNDWDGVLGKESVATTIFEQFYIELMGNIFGDELGDELLSDYVSIEYNVNNAIDKIWENGNSAWCDDVKTKKIETLNDNIAKSFRDAIAILNENYGTDMDDWQWGKVHGLVLLHPMGSVDVLDKIFKFNRGPWPVGGSRHTVSPFSYDSENPFMSDYGSSHRHIYDTSNWDNSLSIIPTGISGIPASKHYCDQTDAYVNNEYRNDYISRDLVEASAKYVQTFTTK